jgi:hypothetical protein
MPNSPRILQSDLDFNPKKVDGHVYCVKMEKESNRRTIELPNACDGRFEAINALPSISTKNPKLA